MTPPAALLSCLDDAFPSDSFPPVLGVAVSGGSDSVGLLHLLHDWGHVPLRVATVDHGLREESAAEASQVAAICTGMRISHDILPWQGWDGSGNLQDQARRARYRLLSRWAADHGIADVALGHTLDDQAETFLLGLSRGAGLDGLCGMRPVFVRSSVRFHRPMLSIRRDALRNMLAKRGVAWVEDPSNRDDRFDRVRARRALTALAPLGIDPDGLGRSIANLRDTRAAIDTTLARWARRHVVQQDGDLLVAVDPFLALPDDFARRLLNTALRWISGADYPPRAAPVMKLLRADQRRTTTLHGCLIGFRGPEIRIGREPEAAARVAAVATNEPWDGRWVLDGPHADDLQIRALGAEGLRDCPDWRDTGRPRASLIPSPAIWRDQTLVSAPIAGYPNGWAAKLVPDRADFAASLIRR